MGADFQFIVSLILIIIGIICIRKKHKENSKKSITIEIVLLTAGALLLLNVIYTFGSCLICFKSVFSNSEFPNILLSAIGIVVGILIYIKQKEDSEISQKIMHDMQTQTSFLVEVSDLFRSYKIDLYSPEKIVISLCSDKQLLLYKFNQNASVGLNGCNVSVNSITTTRDEIKCAILFPKRAFINELLKNFCCEYHQPISLNLKLGCLSNPKFKKYSPDGCVEDICWNVEFKITLILNPNINNDYSRSGEAVTQLKKYTKINGFKKRKNKKGVSFNVA